MEILRRGFLKSVLVASSLYVLGGCKEKGQRDKLIEKLQNSANVKYMDGEGYVYNVEVDGKPVYVNLSKHHFTNHGNVLKYHRGQTDVRVYYNERIKVWYNYMPVDDPNTISIAQKFTDRVLEAVVRENERIREIAPEQARKDLN